MEELKNNFEEIENEIENVNINKGKMFQRQNTIKM